MADHNHRNPQLIDQDQCPRGKNGEASRMARSDMRGPLSQGADTRRWNRFLAIALLHAILLGASALPSAAQEIGDLAGGRRLAETWCSTCHVVIPTSQLGTSNGAPTFSAIARMKSTTPLALRAFLQTPHSRMPDLHLTRDEVDDLTTYILSLRQK